MKAVNVTKLSSNEVVVTTGTNSVVGHTCGRRYGVDNNVWDAKLADTRRSDNCDDETSKPDG